MVITVRCDEWEIKEILAGQGSSADILYWDTFERFHLNLEDLKPFKGSLVGYYEELMQVIHCKDHLWRAGSIQKIKVKYFVIDVYSSYNMIIGRLTFNQLVVALSTLYLCMKYLIFRGRDKVILESMTLIGNATYGTSSSKEFVL